KVIAQVWGQKKAKEERVYKALGFKSAMFGDRPVGTAVNKLVDIRVAAMIQIADRPLPDNFSFPYHRDFIGYFTGRRHVVGNGKRGCTQLFDIFDDQVVNH